MSLDWLDRETRALIGLAGAIARGDESEVEARCRDCMAAAVPPLWVDELFLQSVLIVGWPRALTALAAGRRIGLPIAPGSEDDTVSGRAAEWQARGEVVCREVYGRNYERLRENIQALHPALEAWMITEGYGRTLGRAGLDLARRELCVAIQVAVQGAELQLHAHLKGALNAGASPGAIQEALEIAGPLLGPRELELAMSLWKRIRP